MNTNSLTIKAQEVLQKAALTLLDQQVGVQKVVAQGLGQKYADGALAAAGHTNKGNVVHGNAPNFNTN